MRMCSQSVGVASTAFAAALLACPVFAQNPFPDYGKRFTQYEGNPLLSLESSNPWNLPQPPAYPWSAIPGTIHPDVLYLPEAPGGYKFWMVFTPYDGFAANEPLPPPPWNDLVQYWERMTVMRSHDGINWTGQGIVNPVAHPSPGPCYVLPFEWDNGVHMDPDLIYAPGRGPKGESWFIYFAVYNYCTGGRYTGLLLSHDGIEWAKYGPVMDFGATPSMVFDETADNGEGLFYAWYLLGNVEFGRLGFATSKNGIDWKPYCPNGPAGCWDYAVFEPIPGTCDQGGITHQDVIKRGNEFWMYYQASPYGVNPPPYHDLMIRRAVSTDGIHWTRDAQAILSTSKILADWPACPTSNAVPPPWTFWDRTGPASSPTPVTLLYRASAVPVGNAMYLYFGGLNKTEYTNYDSDRDTGLAFSSRFNDVPPIHWAYAPIEAVAQAGISSGCGSNNFCPDAAAKRKQAAVFLALADQLPLPPYDNRFCDVPNDALAPFILALDNAGVVGAPQGCSQPCANPAQRRFCPDNDTNRLDLGILTYEALGLAPWTGEPHFADVQLPHGPKIDRLFHEGITAGCAAGLFCPGDSGTRAMLSVFTAAGFLEP